MATLTVTNTFAPSTLAEANEVNQNFDDVESFVNGSVMHRDASSAFTAVPAGPASDPVSDNQLTRKAYVDAPFAYSTINASLANETGTGNVGANWTNVSARGVTATATGFTIVTTRVYMVGVAVSWATNATGNRRNFGVRVNGVTNIDGLFGNNTPTVFSSGFGLGMGMGSRPVALTAGDTLACIYNQDSGAPLAITGAFWIMGIPGI